MRLRTILLLLAFLALLSSIVGGYFNYASLQNAFYIEAEKEAALLTSAITSSISSYLSEQLKPVRTLAGMREVRMAFSGGDTRRLKAANMILDHFKESLGVDVCYIMDHLGNTIASSNRNGQDSFVGENFSFRPYFKDALRGTSSSYMALGATSGKRGVYFSYPVFGDDARVPVGVAVIKSSIDLIEQEVSKTQKGIVLLVDPHGIIFISSYTDWLFHSLWELTPEAKGRIEKTFQFGHGPWVWTGFMPAGEN